MNELKKCPFCGSTARVTKDPAVWDDDVWSVYCGGKKCSARLLCFKSEQDAIDAWNRRASDNT